MIELKFEPFIPESITPPSDEYLVYSGGNQVVSEGNIVVSSQE